MVARTSTSTSSNAKQLAAKMNPVTKDGTWVPLFHKCRPLDFIIIALNQETRSLSTLSPCSIDGALGNNESKPSCSMHVVGKFDLTFDCRRLGHDVYSR